MKERIAYNFKPGDRVYNSATIGRHAKGYGTVNRIQNNFVVCNAVYVEWDNDKTVTWCKGGQLLHTGGVMEPLTRALEKEKTDNFVKAGPLRKNPHETSRPGDKGSAKKLDFGKAPIAQGFDNYFANAIFAVAMVSEYGHRKYEDGEKYSGNCLRVPDGYNRYSDAQRRHGIKTVIEGHYDEGDSGLPHLAQEAWNSMMKLERAIRDGMIEVRRGNDIENGKPVLGTAKAVKL